MARTKRSRKARDMAPIHPHAAAIDIGATMHMAAVPPDCDPERCARSAPSPGDCTVSPIGSNAAA
ncbi:hypothetical protein, partial [Azospirillum sp. B506]|uniref:hypothetical protein n=1 Tax=Azospirillum sp. B506 TaxID=137721 RepID=UPI0018FF5612